MVYRTLWSCPYTQPPASLWNTNFFDEVLNAGKDYPKASIPHNLLPIKLHRSNRLQTNLRNLLKYCLFRFGPHRWRKLVSSIFQSQRQPLWGMKGLLTMKEHLTDNNGPMV